MGKLKVNGAIRSQYGDAIAIELNNGSLHTYISTTGGWAREMGFTINDTYMGGFGFHGSGNTAVHKFYVGSDLDSPWMSVTPAGVVTATTFRGALSGNASTATKLATARTISLTGSVTGSGSFDGSGNLSISTTTNHSHSYLLLSGGTMSGAITMNVGTGIQMKFEGGKDTRWIYPEGADTFGIRYYEGNPDRMTISASGNNNTTAGADLCINGNGDGTVTIRGNTILHAGNYSSYALPLSGGTVGQTTFYGPYGDPRGVIIREGSLSGTAHNSNSAAPTLNFWWEGKCQGSLLMNSSGNYYLTIEGNRAYLDANVPYATAADTANSATSATYSTYAGTTWVATCQGLKWRRICYVATDVGTVGTSGILNIRATRGNYVVNASFIICSSHSKQCQIVQLSSTYYSNVQIRGVVDSSGNFYIELYDDQVSIASGTNQSYYCSWLPLTRNSITVYTGSTSGTTVPDGFAVSTGFRTAPGPYVVGNFVTHNFGSSLPSSAPYGAIFYKT